LFIALMNTLFDAAGSLFNIDRTDADSTRDPRMARALLRSSASPPSKTTGGIDERTLTR
jgi:hypothetical protein